MESKIQFSSTVIADSNPVRNKTHTHHHTRQHTDMDSRVQSKWKYITHITVPAARYRGMESTVQLKWQNTTHVSLHRTTQTHAQYTSIQLAMDRRVQSSSNYTSLHMLTKRLEEQSSIYLALNRRFHFSSQLNTHTSPHGVTHRHGQSVEFNQSGYTAHTSL